MMGRDLIEFAIKEIFKSVGSDFKGATVVIDGSLIRIDKEDEFAEWVCNKIRKKDEAKSDK
jgi:hypothetical protein